MIIKSTPWSISWQESADRVITFHGEWTLEPKFYLLLPLRPCWDGSKTIIDVAHLEKIIDKFKKDAHERGWILVIEQESDQGSKQ